MNGIPEKSFPYTAPTQNTRKKYSYLYELSEPIKFPLAKLIFDKLVALSILALLVLPAIVLIKISYVIEGCLFPSNRGPIFYFYFSVSEGRVIKKWKIRQFKLGSIDKKLAEKHLWEAYSAEWDRGSLTYTGRFVKNHYLDELPQFWAVLMGDMSIVGPRPLSLSHYERDLGQGNVFRKLVRGGVLGFGHIRKGTPDFGNPDFDFEYAHIVASGNWTEVLKIDMWVIYRGLLLVLKGGGH